MSRRTLLASMPGLATRPARRPAGPPTLTGSVVINDFVNAIRVIPPGGPVPAESDAPGRCVVILPLSGGFTMTLTQTAPTPHALARWEGIEGMSYFRRRGITIDRRTGELIGGEDWDPHTGEWIGDGAPPIR